MITIKIIHQNTEKKQSVNGIHNGEVTQTQDQSMLPVNFKTRNTMNKIPANDILVLF